MVIWENETGEREREGCWHTVRFYAMGTGPRNIRLPEKPDSPLDKAIYMDRGRIPPHKVTRMRQALMARSILQ